MFVFAILLLLPTLLLGQPLNPSLFLPPSNSSSIRFIILMKGEFGLSSFLAMGTQATPPVPAPALNFSFPAFHGLVYDVPASPDVVSFSGAVDSISSSGGLSIGANGTLTSSDLPPLAFPAPLSFLNPISQNIIWVEISKTVSTLAIQDPAPWNLVRISQHSRVLPSPYRYIADGRGVDAYIVDSGIFSEHNDFAGHASTIIDFTNSGLTDTYGHGTHVAGIVGSQTYGVAKRVNLLGVRVIGGPVSIALNAAIGQLVAMNIPVVSAAGNDASNACVYSPSSSTAGVTVAASDYQDYWFPQSNSGPCVFMIAPGSYVISTFIGSTTSIAAMSGTSMAAPHVTGVIALLLSMNPNLTVPQIKMLLAMTSTNGAIGNVPVDGTANRFLYSLANY